jgi:hypothetical protein
MMVMTREPDDTSVNFESPTQRLTQSCQTVYIRYKQPLTLISNNKSDHHDMTEMLLKVTLNIINEAVIYFRPVMLAKFGDPGYTALIIWFHFAQ